MDNRQRKCTPIKAVNLESVSKKTKRGWRLNSNIPSHQRTEPSLSRIAAEKGIIFPKISLKEWIKKHDLEVQFRSCPNCFNKVFTTIPYKSKNCVGVTTPDCECGYQVRRSFSKVINKKELASLRRVFFYVRRFRLFTRS